MADSFETTVGGVTTTVDLDKAYDNLMAASSAFIDLTFAMAFLMGTLMIFRGIGMYRAFGQHITQMSGNRELAGPVVYIFVGAFLLYLPSMIDASLTTVFGTTDLTKLEYSGTASDSIDWSKVLDLVNSYAKLIGLIAFVRGLYIVSKSGDPGVQPGTISRGIVHFFAGVLLINIGLTYDILATTFGLSVEGVAST